MSIMWEKFLTGLQNWPHSVANENVWKCEEVLKSIKVERHNSMYKVF